MSKVVYENQNAEGHLTAGDLYMDGRAVVHNWCVWKTGAVFSGTVYMYIYFVPHFIDLLVGLCIQAVVCNHFSLLYTTV